MSSSVEAVSGQCRLTPVSVCRAVPGCSVGQCRGSLTVEMCVQCQGVKQCRSVGVSECRGVDRCRGVGVSMPYTDGKHSLAKLQVSISEIKQYFHQDIYGRQPLAVACVGKGG